MWKVFKYVGSAAGKLFSSAKKIYKGVGASRKGVSIWRTVGRRLWKVADIGLTAYALWDLFVSDGDDDLISRSEHLDMVLDAVLTPAVKTVLESDINDPYAVSQGLVNQGLALLSEDLNAPMVQGLSYICLSQYILECKSGHKLTPANIKTVIAGEFTAFLTSGLPVAQNGESEDDLNAADIQEAMLAMDFESMDIDSLRKYDYLAYFLQEMSDATSYTATTAAGAASSKANSPGSNSDFTVPLNADIE